MSRDLHRLRLATWCEMQGRDEGEGSALLTRGTSRIAPTRRKPSDAVDAGRPSAKSPGRVDAFVAPVEEKTGTRHAALAADDSVSEPYPRLL